MEREKGREDKNERQKWTSRLMKGGDWEERLRWREKES